MKINIPNWLIILGGVGQIFTALIYPYIRHKVFDWYNDVKQLKPLNQEIVKTYGRYSTTPCMIYLRKCFLK